MKEDALDLKKTWLFCAQFAAGLWFSEEMRLPVFKAWFSCEQFPFVLFLSAERALHL